MEIDKLSEALEAFSEAASVSAEAFRKLEAVMHDVADSRPKVFILGTCGGKSWVVDVLAEQLKRAEAIEALRQLEVTAGFDQPKLYLAQPHRFVVDEFKTLTNDNEIVSNPKNKPYFRQFERGRKWKF